MLSRRPRENFPKISKFASLKRAFNCVSFQYTFLEKCPFFKIIFGLIFFGIGINFKSIIIHSDFD